jgi:hypothetical protein
MGTSPLTRISRSGYGAIGRWEFGDHWHLALALDSVAFDYETPYRLLGIDSTEEIDRKNEFMRLSISVERRRPLR